MDAIYVSFFVFTQNEFGECCVGFQCFTQFINVLTFSISDWADEVNHAIYKMHICVV